MQNVLHVGKGGEHKQSSKQKYKIKINVIPEEKVVIYQPWSNVIFPLEQDYSMLMSTVLFESTERGIWCGLDAVVV